MASVTPYIAVPWNTSINGYTVAYTFTLFLSFADVVRLIHVTLYPVHKLCSCFYHYTVLNKAVYSRGPKLGSGHSNYWRPFIDHAAAQLHNFLPES